MPHQPLRGVLSPTVTPLNKDGSIDMELYAALSLHLLENEGCVGLVPFGTTGEALSFSVKERIDAVASLVAYGIPAAKLVPGTGVCNFAETLQLTQAAAKLGCHGALVLPPFFIKNVSEEGLFLHYSRLAEAINRDGFGLYLYHIPQVSGVGIPTSLAKRLHSTFPDRIVGIKDSSGNWDNTSSLLDIPDFVVYPGNEERLLEALQRGSPGTITATANIAAAPIARLIQFYDAGDMDKAEKQMAVVKKIRMTLNDVPMIPSLKRVLALGTGIRNWADVRPPLLPATEDQGRRLGNKIGIPLDGASTQMAG